MSTTQLFSLTSLFFLLTGLLLTPPEIHAQNTPNLAERLGYGPDAKLLIVHADDIGMSHSVNEASFDALLSGAVSSGSVMVPCPWFPDAAERARQHPELDLGIHVTLTAEWKNYRWDSVLPRSEVPTLHDSLGFLHATGEPFARVDPGEVEREVRAQIDRAIELGIKPTHLDTHMGTLFASQELIELYIRLGKEYNVPVFLPRQWAAMAPQMASILGEDAILIDQYFILYDGIPAEEWPSFYSNIIEKLPPGVSQIIVHLAYDTPEMQAITVDHDDFGSAWRQRDYDFFTSDTFRELLEKHEVKLITWREIGKLLKK